MGQLLMSGHCGTCNIEWKSLAEAHCPSCCRHFSSDTSFDLHLQDDRCLAPAAVKKRDGSPVLVKLDREREYAVWGQPPPPDGLFATLHEGTDERKAA